MIEFRIDVDGVEADLQSSCPSIYEKDTLTPSIPGTRLALEPAEFTAFRASYRCLAWRENRLGRPLRSDLLGDDQPEPVARQYEAETAWLTHTI